jgi:peptide/nickel transport system permease protein
VMISANLLAKGINRIFPPKRKIALPIDIIVMRLIEIMNSIPNLIFLLAILAIIEKSSIINVMIIIGLIGWTGIARFVRSELLRIRALDYIEAARSMGFTNFRILMRHAIPNALTPVLISIAFGVAGAILTEASLSFLGIGMPTDEVTWGKILNLSRANISSWWLAIFPGFAIFITVTIFNLIGEGLTDAINPNLKQ